MKHEHKNTPPPEDSDVNIEDVQDETTTASSETETPTETPNETLFGEQIPPKTEEEDYKNKYFLLLADMENARKRLSKEKQNLIQFALEDLLLDFLSPLDTFEQSLGFCKNMSPEIQNWAVGFQMVLDQFHSILEKNHVQPFKSVGSMFDPHKHDAIETVTSLEHPDGYVLEEVLCGYLRRDKILRVARVKVVKNQASSE